MHLVFVHGVPGVGKRTVCNELSARIGFPFFNGHHIAVTLGPVFGFSTPRFNTLRDQWCDSVIESAAAEALPGLVGTVIFEPSVAVASYERYCRLAEASGGATLFAGLTCTPDELRLRVTSADRAPLGKWTDFEALQRTMASGYFDFPASLPGRSMVIDTSARSAADVAREIADSLPRRLRPGA